MEWRGGVGGGGVSESIPPALPHLENDVEKYRMINTAELVYDDIELLHTCFLRMLPANNLY